jgi:hypothetical protein
MTRPIVISGATVNSAALIFVGVGPVRFQLKIAVTQNSLRLHLARDRF